MKKLLALVLALVMTLGLATVAANASYPDEADVSLDEAVDVMTAVGVFKGDEKGNFLPKANLDRAAAAKLVAYLDLGEKAAEALPAVQAFNDVPATHWAAKYIAYCADAGYIAGAGDGNFYPSNALTGYAFGKMILCVLGYDAAVEGFTGASWTISVAKLMQSNDIADGVDAAASGNLIREQAAQYCFNALKADMVEYDSKGTSIEINGAKISTGASKSEKISETKKDYDGSADGVQQLCEKLYGTDLKKVASTKSDDFGAPAVAWKYKNSDVGTYSDSPDQTYTGKVTKGTIYTLIGKDVADDIKDGKANMDVYKDGVKTSGVTNETVKNSSAAAFGSGKGTVTEVFIDDDGYNGYAQITVVLKNTYVLKASGNYNSNTEKLSYKAVTGKAGSGSLSADDFSIADYKKDDYILYTYANNKIQTIEKATLVSGKVEKFTSGDSVTIAGTSYGYSTTVTAADKNTAYSIGDTAKVVLDAQGNIIAVDSAKESNDDVVYVKEVAPSNGFEDEFKAKIVTVEGKKLTVDVDTDSTDSNDAKISSSNFANFKGFMAYEIEDDGSYKLSSYSKVTKTPAKTTLSLNKVYDVAGKTANSSTVYIVENSDGDITLYTGVKNAPKTITFTSADSAYVVYNSDNEVTYLYVDASSDVEDAGSENDQQIYVLKIDSRVRSEDVNGKTKKYYVVEALVDGTLNKELKVADGNTPFAVGKLYKSMKTNSDGYVTGATAVSSKFQAISVADAADAFKFDDGVFSMTGLKRGVKTDKVYLVITGSHALVADNDLDDTTYNFVDGCADFDSLEAYVNGYTVTATGYVLLDGDDADDDIVAAYITITDSIETSIS